LFRDLLLNSKIRTGWGEDFTIMSDWEPDNESFNAGLM
jgi:hypothetical protein